MPRMEAVGLALHPDKTTRIVDSQDSRSRCSYGTYLVYVRGVYVPGAGSTAQGWG